MTISEDVYTFLDKQCKRFNRPEFIESDPVSIPHLFSGKEDIEISGFLAATIAWGQRVCIVRNARRLLALMDNSPYSFILHAKPSDLREVQGFVHRTFNGDDLLFFIEALRNIYTEHGGLEAVFTEGFHNGEQSAYRAINHFREIFLGTEHLKRSEKHIAYPGGGSSAKRINMYLRWMVRRDEQGVDFGLWKEISPAALCCPLDVHSGTTARKLGLLIRKQNDWKSVEELTANLRKFDPEDPVKYDFALFGLGNESRIMKREYSEYP